jgi:hypothetical protein
VAWSLLKYQGDTAIHRFYPGLIRFMDNEIHRATVNSTLGLRNMFATFGDWIWLPGAGSGARNILPGGTETNTDIHLTASFSFVRDIEHMVAISTHLGEVTDARKYTTVLAEMKAAWHKAWYNRTLGCYGYSYYGTFTCGQTSNALGLVLDAAPPAELPRVVDFLIADVLSHGNHTTTGLIGWRNLLDALSKAGRDDLAWAIITQKTYPSLGFELLNKLEPATTLWEQWDAVEMDQGMNSRNHAMMAGPTSWFYLVAAGLTQPEQGIGWSTVVFAPPPQLIMQALAADTRAQFQQRTNSSLGLRHVSASKQTLRGTVAIEWSLPKKPRVDGFCYSGVCVASQLHTKCAEANSTTKQYLPLHLGCNNFPMNNITTISFAEWGDGRGKGSCSSDGDGGSTLRNGSCGFDLRAQVAERCVGQSRCTVMCGWTSSTTYGYSPGVGSADSGCVIVTPADGPPPFYRGATFVPFSAPHFDPCFGRPGWYNGYLSLRLAHSCGENPGTILKIKVTVPPNSDAATRVPLLGSAPTLITITEGGRVVWSDGAFVEGGAPGVVSARVVPDVVEIHHGSGIYEFVRANTKATAAGLLVDAQQFDRAAFAVVKTDDEQNEAMSAETAPPNNFRGCTPTTFGAVPIASEEFHDGVANMLRMPLAVTKDQQLIFRRLVVDITLVGRFLRGHHSSPSGTRPFRFQTMIFAPGVTLTIPPAHPPQDNTDTMLSAVLTELRDLRSEVVALKADNAALHVSDRRVGSAAFKTDDAVSSAVHFMQTALRGTFVSLSQSVCDAAGDWHTELAAMAALRMDTIVTISSVSTEANKSTAFYPSALPFVSTWLEGKADCVGKMLEAAHKRRSFQVHLGLELNYAFDRTWWRGSGNVSFFQLAAAHNIQIMEELQQLYRKKYAGTLVGVYDSNEINDVEMNYWEERVYYRPWIENYLRPTHSHATTLNLTSSNAPYFCHSGSNPAGWGPAAVAAFYRKMLDDIKPRMQRLWVQDCLGVSTGELYGNRSGNWFDHPAEVLPFYSALAAMTKSLEPPRSLWSD